MRAWLKVHPRDGMPYDINSYSCYYGFGSKGFELKLYSDSISGIDDLVEGDIFHGGVIDVMRALDKLGVKRPEVLDYPEELKPYLGREIIKTTLERALNGQEIPYPFFIKPSKTHKLFTGKLLRRIEDEITMNPRLVNLSPDTEVYISEPVQFVSEYRCYVVNGNVFGVGNYMGTHKYYIDPNVLENAIKDYINAPAAYGMDLGVTREGKILLVEINDFTALGNYCLDPFDYTLGIEVRWKQLVKSKL